MARILITGATGFLGREIVKQAIAEGHHVVGLRRQTSWVGDLESLPVEWRLGDVTDPDSLARTVEGVEMVIHTAGDTSYHLRDRAKQERVNVQGVRNIIDAAKRAGVRRLVHTSSVAAIGFDPGGKPVNEKIAWNWPVGLPYMETKRDGEAIALAAQRLNFEVVVLNPATILGPGKMNASEEQLVRDVREGKMPAVPSGGMTIGDVEDIARAHLLALSRGRSGERYILGGHHITHRELVDRLAAALGARKPGGTAPAWILGGAGALLYWIEKMGIKTELPAAVVRLSRFEIYHDSTKAVSELGYAPRPLPELLSRVVSARGKKGMPA